MIDYVWLRDRHFYPTDLAEMNRLLQRLSVNSPTLTQEDLVRLASQPGMHIILCVDTSATNTIVGMARLTEVPMLVGSEGVIADVVVDERYGRNGIGRVLMRLLMELARKARLRRVALICWPENEAANRLYKSLGFEQLGVNYYRLKL